MVPAFHTPVAVGDGALCGASNTFGMTHHHAQLEQHLLSNIRRP